MTYLAKPRLHHPTLPENRLGYTRRDYEGKISTLCAGCGHDSISAAIVQACFEIDLEPHKLAKISGIGCSSKTPAYFLNNSHGFNSVHGRMPSVATGADGSYPISRGLFMYTAGEPTGAIRDYLDWLLGAEGQTIVAELGFVPLPKE